MIPISLLSAVYAVGLGNVMYFALTQAYSIRMIAIEEYGRVIHEFDPYFNYRATEYLWQHGWYKFRTWFDYQSWYPLGRPVGTTIYPGMQVTSCLIKKYILPTWSINDICCFVPVWFGVLATLATAMLAYECCVGVYYNKDATPTTNSDDTKTESSNGSSNDASSKANSNKKKKPAASKTTSAAAKQEESSALQSLQAFNTILNDIPIVKQLYQLVVVPIWRKIILKYWIRFTGSPYGLCVYDTKSLSSQSTEWSTPALEAAIVTALCMSIVPAHLMRSVGGGYDNESIAVFAMTFTFYCWVRSLRGGPERTNYLWGIVSGLAYFNMVAAWGGYVFVLNLIGMHASVLVLLGRYSTKVHRSYTCFYLVGTALATQIPVVGLTPLKSLEQIGPLLTFAIYQLLEICQIILRRKKKNQQQQNKKTKNKKKNGATTTETDAFNWKEWLTVHIQVFGIAALIAVVIGYFLVEAGYFGPISSRVRGLFVKHTKTGNPLVDSVAEHQPANDSAYKQYLGLLVNWVPWGFGIVALTQFHDGSSFLVVYGVAAYYFSNKMVRLILLTAPISSVLSGIAVAHIWSWGMTALFGQRPSLTSLLGSAVGGKSSTPNTVAYKENILLRLLRLGAFVYLGYTYHPQANEFYKSCHELSKHLSHPTIIQKGRTRDGNDVVVDDYREAYLWLKHNTPEDARILAWWDYGYQIAGIANRTTIADGNTWNHEHIALLGRTLTSPLKDGHRIARHLADYVLVWAGGGGDDVAKSPHMRRIANSVYRFLCPNDPTCRNFGMDRQGGPTPAIRESLLFQLHSHKIVPGVEADKNRFRHVKVTKHGKVRIFKILSVSESSKEWVKNNRVCDAPGSWFCPGQYPPALQKILNEKKDFRQLEDFNADQDHDSEYTKQYFENLNNPEKAKRAAAASQKVKDKNDPNKPTKKLRRLSKEERDMMNNPDAWDDNEGTTAVWNAIHSNMIKEFRAMLIENPELAHIRSKDGRGPMWWAHEYGRSNFVTLLTKLGVSSTELKDENGLAPNAISTIKN